MNNKADFGYRQVDVDAKAGYIREVFDSVSDRYDVMNDLMSLGLHRLWKRFTVGLAGLQSGQVVLDLAGGTADLAMLAHPRVQPRGRVLVCDINARMLAAGRDRLLDRGIVGGVDLVQADAESLPFAECSIDRVFIGFGLRNLTDKARALRAMYTALRPGGRVLVLEFSTLRVKCLQPLYDGYSFGVLPRLGEWVAADADSYRYLAESIRLHPDQDALQAMMEASGFEHCDHYNLCGGIVAVHSGWRL